MNSSCYGDVLVSGFPVRKAIKCKKFIFTSLIAHDRSQFIVDIFIDSINLYSIKCKLKSNSTYVETEYWSTFTQPQRVVEHVIFHMVHGPLARYSKLRVRMRRECWERFSRHRR